MVPEDVYACIVDDGFQVDSRYKIQDGNCIGPEPEHPYGTIFTVLERHLHFGYTIVPMESSPDFRSEDYCVSFFEADIVQAGERKAHYVICSPGGGSGGLEYTATAFTEFEGRIYVAFEWKQKQSGVPNFQRAFKTLLTIEN